MPGEPSFFEIGVHDANPGRPSYAALFGSCKFCRDDQGSPFALHPPPGR